MKREKSCGAIVFREANDKQLPELLLVKHRCGGHWSFPKGHVEAGENEIQTAVREVKEETGLDITLLKGFRERVEYAPKPGVMKEVVYFLARAKHDHVVMQEKEIAQTMWVDIEQAERVVTFDNHKNLIRKAKAYMHW